MAAGVEDKDRGWDAIRSNVKRADGAVVAIGIQGPEAGAVVHDDTALSNVELGVIHEFGAPGAGIPERSFIRSTFDAKVGEWTRLMVDVAEKIYDTPPAVPLRLLDITGQKVRADIINAINQGIPPALQQATIDAKGSSKPLIDTGQLKGSITHKVRP